MPFAVPFLNHACGAAYSSIPFLSQEEISNISVLDAVAAHVELIQRNNILREIVAYIVICAKLTGNRLI